MDAPSYGRMVERGGYATGGIVQDPRFVLFGDGTPETRWELRGEPGPEVPWLTAGACVTIAGSTIELGLLAARDPDDGTAGVPARV